MIKVWLTNDIVSFEQMGPGWIANSIESDQPPRSAATDEGELFLSGIFYLF